MAQPLPKQLAWLLTQPRAALTGAECAAVPRIAQNSEAASVAALVRRFAEFVRSSGVVTFAVGLRQDIAAVRAPLTTLWASGQAEGQISKLKLIKRQTCGRASFDLLRRRVLLAV